MRRSTAAGSNVLSMGKKGSGSAAKERTVPACQRADVESGHRERQRTKSTRLPRLSRRARRLRSSGSYAPRAIRSISSRMMRSTMLGRFSSSQSLSSGRSISCARPRSSCESAASRLMASVLKAAASDWLVAAENRPAVGAGLRHVARGDRRLSQHRRLLCNGLVERGPMQRLSDGGAQVRVVVHGPERRLVRVGLGGGQLARGAGAANAGSASGALVAGASGGVRGERHVGSRRSRPSPPPRRIAAFADGSVLGRQLGDSRLRLNGGSPP